MDEHNFIGPDKLETLENMNIPLKRASKDRKTNIHGLALLDICRNNELFVLNGRLGRDKNFGELTFRNTSLIDYVISSVNSFKLVDNFCVQENDPLFSDGNAFLEWSFRAHCISKLDKIRRNTNINYAQQWDEQKAELYKNNIDTEKLKNIFEYIENCRNSPVSIENVTRDINAVLTTTAIKTFQPNTTPPIHIQNKKTWFGAKCNKLRKEYHKCRLNYTKLKNQKYRENLNKASKECKKTMNHFINTYKQKIAKTLRQLCTKKSKKILENTKNTKTQSGRKEATPP